MVYPQLRAVWCTIRFDKINFNGRRAVMKVAKYCIVYVPVVTEQPQIVMMQPMPLENPPSDGIYFAIFVTMCCCLPIGIFAIIRSVQCRAAIEVINLLMRVSILVILFFTIATTTIIVIVLLFTFFFSFRVLFFLLLLLLTLLYWYGQLVAHQPLVVYLCVGKCICLSAGMSPCCSAHGEWLIMKL